MWPRAVAWPLRSQGFIVTLPNGRWTRVVAPRHTQKTRRDEKDGRQGEKTLVRPLISAAGRRPRRPEAMLRACPSASIPCSPSLVGHAYLRRLGTAMMLPPHFYAVPTIAGATSPHPVTHTWQM